MFIQNSYGEYVEESYLPNKHKLLFANVCVCVFGCFDTFVIKARRFLFSLSFYIRETPKLDFGHFRRETCMFRIIISNYCTNNVIITETMILTYHLCLHRFSEGGRRRLHIWTIYILLFYPPSIYVGIAIDSNIWTSSYTQLLQLHNRFTQFDDNVVVT